ncbi:MAG: hypothetical protein IAE97_13095 [Chthoniobacterales bacterium]|nr:hypothetical protein [Chthoniobacterales bacterium]
MRPRLSLAALAVVLVLSAACERIPPSVSIPGYAEKHASEEKKASGPMGVSEKPPAFFPAKGGE